MVATICVLFLQSTSIKTETSRVPVCAAAAHQGRSYTHEYAGGTFIVIYMATKHGDDWSLGKLMKCHKCKRKSFPSLQRNWTPKTFYKVSFVQWIATQFYNLLVCNLITAVIWLLVAPRSSSSNWWSCVFCKRNDPISS